MGSSLNLPFGADNAGADADADADADVPLEEAEGSRVRDDAEVDADDDGWTRSIVPGGDQGRRESDGERALRARCVLPDPAESMGNYAQPPGTPVPNAVPSAQSYCALRVVR
jgi:hypothetical protein